MKRLANKFLGLTPNIIHLAIRASLLNTICYLGYLYTFPHNVSFIFAATGVFLTSIIETLVINHSISKRIWIAVFVSLSCGATLILGSMLSQSILATSIGIIFFMCLVGITSQANLFITMAILMFSCAFITGTNFPATLNHGILFGLSLTVGGLVLAVSSYIQLKWWGSTFAVIEPIYKQYNLFSFKLAQIDFSVRLIVSVLGSYLLSYLLHLEQAYWVPLTATVILKLENGYTFRRLKERFTGTLYGSILAVIIISLIHDKLLLTLMLLPVTFLIIASLAKHYGAYAFFLTAMITISFNIIEPLGWLITEKRIINTVLGIMIVGFVTCMSHYINKKLPSSKWS